MIHSCTEATTIADEVRSTEILRHYEKLKMPEIQYKFLLSSQSTIPEFSGLASTAPEPSWGLTATDDPHFHKILDPPRALCRGTEMDVVQNRRTVFWA